MVSVQMPWYFLVGRCSTKIPIGLYHSPWFSVFTALHFISRLVLHRFVVQCIVVCSAFWFLWFLMVSFYSCLRCSIYSGHQSILIPPGEVELNPALWLTVVSQEKGYCSLSVKTVQPWTCCCITYIVKQFVCTCPLHLCVKITCLSRLRFWSCALNFSLSIPNTPCLINIVWLFFQYHQKLFVISWL